MTCKHVWFEIESDNNGKPTKYKCVLCEMVYDVKPKLNNYIQKHFDAKNSIINKIYENKQKIEFIKRYPIDFNQKIHLEHLETELLTLNRLLTRYNI